MTAIGVLQGNLICLKGIVSVLYDGDIMGLLWGQTFVF